MPRARARRWERALAALALALPAAACTLLTPLDGLTGGRPDAGDGGEPGADATVASADGAVTPTRDAGSDGGAAPSDAARGADAEASVDGAAGPYCASLDAGATTLLFCDDFDEGPLAAPWDQVTGTGATASLAGGIVTSPPNAMLVQTDVDAGNVDCSGYKSFSKAPVTGYYTLAFDLYVASADQMANSDVVLAALELVDPYGSTWALQLELSYDSTKSALAVDFSENGTPGDGGKGTYTAHNAAATTTIPIGTWTRVSMEAEILKAAGPGSSANIGILTLDGALAVEASMHVATTNGTPEILVGVTYAQPSTEAWTIRYDDVTLTYVP